MSIVTFKEVATGIRTKLLATGAITDILPVDAWGGVHRGKPPTDALFPLIRMQMQSDSQDLTTLGDTVFQLYYISVICVSEDADEADELNALCFAALNRQAITIGSPDKHGNTSRTGTIWYQEGAERTFTHSGGIYRIGVRI